MIAIVLDAGALIALERGDPKARAYVFLAEHGQATLVTSAAVVARVWRGSARQARISRLLASDLVTEVPLDPAMSRRIGALAAAVGCTDVVDGHVAVVALEREAFVMTSDPEDIMRWGVDERRIVRC